MSAERRSASPGDDLVRVMVVCTGNIARSPLAEVMLQQRAREHLGENAPVWVDSCGLSAVPGNPAVSGSRTQALSRGLDLSHHRATPADPDELDDCELVLTMTAAHRRRLARAWPRGAARTFTLHGFASAAEAARPEDADGLAEHVRAVVAAADRARERGGDTPGDVDDPYGAGSAVFEQLGADLDELTDAVAAALFADAPDSAAGGRGTGRAGGSDDSLR